jgi:ABC-2 type transport system permease protein
VNPGALTVYRWELVKLRFQKRTYLGLGAAVVIPIIFAVAVALRDGEPDEVAFGRYIQETGFAIPLVLLLFGSLWMFPLIAALVAGDIVASEDHNGTLKTVLTRSVDRGRIFVGKVLAVFTYTILALVLNMATALAAGGIVSGFNEFPSLSGTIVTPGEALGLIAASYLVYLMPMIAIACIGILLSTVTRNSAAAVVGTLMFSLLVQILGILPGLEGAEPYLLSEQFEAWEGLLRDPIDWAPVARAAWVCPLYAVPSLIAAYLVFLRRDVAGG